MGVFSLYLILIVNLLNVVVMKHKLGNYGVAAYLLSHCQMTSIYQLYTFLPRYKPKNRPIFFIHIVDSMHTFTPRSEVDNSLSV